MNNYEGTDWAGRKYIHRVENNHYCAICGGWTNDHAPGEHGKV